METEPIHVEHVPGARAHLRVALVTETWPPEINGVAMTLQRMVQGLLARGHAVQLVRPRQHAADGSSEGIDTVFARGLPLPRYNGLRVGLPAKAALIRRWRAHRPDIVHVATEGPLGHSAVAAARHLDLPVASAFHTNFHAYSGHYGVGFLRKPIEAWLRRFHNRCDATCVPTRALMRELALAGFERLELVARGVDTALFDPARRAPALRESWGAGPDDLVVLHVGRLAPEKNLTLVLDAFAAIRACRPDAKLVFVGDGPSRKALQAQHPGHHYAGMRSGEDLAAHYASGDLFLFPSLTETFGNVTLEAMASGLPVLAFEHAAAGDLIVSGANGCTVKASDAPAYCRAAAELAGDAQLRRRCATAARASMLALDWTHIHDAFAAMLLRLTWQHGRMRNARTAWVMAPD